MIETARRMNSSERELSAARAPNRLSTLKFYLRYPIFLLAFGPPIFRPLTAATDTSQAHFDLWSVFQVGWISLIALFAILRLSSAPSILIPKQIRSILKYFFFLGLLFLASVAYSPGRIVSLEFGILYLLTFICMVDFIVDVYRNPPNWIQCMFQLRLVALILLACVILTLPFAPGLVLQVIPGAGLRLNGGTVGNTPLICPIIAIISAYSFRHSLESRFRSTLFFLVSTAGTLVTQSRGTEIALLIVLLLISIGWAKASKRSAHIFISGVMITALFAGVVVASIGGGRIWSTFNRGQDIQGIATASGRTEIWKFAIEYSMTHPLGMGYVAGFRAIFTKHFDPVLGAGVAHLGTTHNAFIQYLVDGGWLGLAFYLIMLVKIFTLGWRLARKDRLVTNPADKPTRHGLRCALLLFVFSIAEGMESSTFNVPLQAYFYYQNIIVAVILGTSARILFISRRGNHFWRGDMQ